MNQAAVDTAPVLNLAPKDIEGLWDELEAYHAI